MNRLCTRTKCRSSRKRAARGNRRRALSRPTTNCVVHLHIFPHGTACGRSANANPRSLQSIYSDAAHTLRRENDPRARHVRSHRDATVARTGDRSPRGIELNEYESRAACLSSSKGIGLKPVVNFTAEGPRRESPVARPRNLRVDYRRSRGRERILRRVRFVLKWKQRGDRYRALEAHR